MYNRRVSKRVNRQCTVAYEYQGAPVTGIILNVSETGARVLLRHPAQETLQLCLELDEAVQLEAKAETIWEEPLRGGACIRGLRFLPGGLQQSGLKRWLMRNS